MAIDLQNGPGGIVGSYIQQASTISNQLRELAEARIDAAMATASNVRSLEQSNAPTKPSYVTKPNLPDTSNMLLELGRIDTEIDAKIRELTEVYTTQIFPLDTNITAAQAWIARAISGAGIIDPVLEERIFARDRSRRARDAQQAADTAMAQWAGRGYALPPGQAVGAVLAVQRESLAANAAASSAAAIETYKMEVGLVQAAVDLAIKTRVELVTHMAEYVKLAAVAPTIRMEMKKTAADAQRAMTEAAKVYFDIDMAYARANFSNDRDYIEFARNFDLSKFTTEMQRSGTKTGLASQAAQMAATMAAAALNGIHASAAVSGNSSDSTTTQLFG